MAAGKFGIGDKVVITEDHGYLRRYKVGDSFIIGKIWDTTSFGNAMCYSDGQHHGVFECHLEYSDIKNWKGVLDEE